MPSPAALAEFLDADPKDFAELTALLHRIMDAWLDAGGESTDELVIGFYGIESQIADVPIEGRDRQEDQADFYHFFYPAFIRDRDEIRKQIGGQP